MSNWTPSHRLERDAAERRAAQVLAGGRTRRDRVTISVALAFAVGTTLALWALIVWIVYLVSAALWPS